MMIIIDTETEDIDDYDCYNRHRVKVRHDKGLNKMSGKIVKRKTKSPNLMILKSFNSVKLLWFLHLVSQVFELLGNPWMVIVHNT